MRLTLNVEEYMTNCVIPLLENLKSGEKTEAQTIQNEQREQRNNLSKESHMNEPKPNGDKQNKRSSFLPHQKTVIHVNNSEI